VIKGKWGLRINLSREQSESGANAIKAVTPTGPVNTAILSPQNYDNVNFDNTLYFSQKHSMRVGVGYNRQKSERQGVGNFDLEDRAYNNNSRGWNLQLSDNLTINSKMTNTLNFRVNGGNSHTRPLT